MEQKLSCIHNMVGWNYRMTEMQSAIGLAELDRMDNWNMPRHRRNARIIMNALKDLPQIKYLPIDTPERQNGFCLFCLPDLRRAALPTDCRGADQSDSGLFEEEEGKG